MNTSCDAGLRTQSARAQDAQGRARPRKAAQVLMMLLLKGIGIVPLLVLFVSSIVDKVWTLQCTSAPRNNPQYPYMNKTKFAAHIKHPYHLQHATFSYLLLTNM